jgi:uncharacterized protein YbjT (DUF2867 family)
MKIAITTPTGHVGGSVADFLLDVGADVNVKLLGRRPEKLTKFVGRGAVVAIGAQDDADYLIQATRGADALFWATPPGYGSDNVRAFQNRLGKAGATAVRSNNIPRVVVLSSIGANFASGVGPINGLHDVEDYFGETAANVTFLRPGFFFENLLWQLDSIRKWGRIALSINGYRSFPMIATRDIGRVAADLLRDRTWTGHHVRELHGPADLCHDDVARIFTEVLGRKIVYVKCDRDEMRKAMLDNAISENACDLMLEMYDAIETGRLQPTQPRSPDSTTWTTLAEFARDVLLPMIAEPVTH